MFQVLLIIFLVCAGIQCCYYLFIFSRFAFYKTKGQSASVKKDVSVIVCAKNEAENLQELIPLLLDQAHPDYEIIIVNDRSWDHSEEVIESFMSASSKIKMIRVEHNETFWGNKKYALTLGIKAATKSVLLFTDADCRPASKNWVTKMTAQISDDKTLVLGYGAYNFGKSFLNRLIRFETLMTAIQYLSYAKAGIPYMGVGRNLAYKRSLFFENNGFIKHMKILSGDDDLFVNEVATRKNTSICVDPESFTNSVPKTTFASWIFQKRRHITTAKHYKLGHKLLLGLYFLSKVLFWILAILLLAIQYQWMIVAGVLVLVLLIGYIVLGSAAKRLQEAGIVALYPVYELFLVSIQFFIFIANLISKPNHWK